MCMTKIHPQQEVHSHIPLWGMWNSKEYTKRRLRGWFTRLVWDRGGASHTYVSLAVLSSSEPCPYYKRGIIPIVTVPAHAHLLCVLSIYFIDNMRSIPRFTPRTLVDTTYPCFHSWFMKGSRPFQF